MKGNNNEAVSNVCGDRKIIDKALATLLAKHFDADSKDTVGILIRIIDNMVCWLSLILKIANTFI